MLNGLLTENSTKKFIDTVFETKSWYNNLLQHQHC
jgi:hypothetical protein